MSTSHKAPAEKLANEKAAQWMWTLFIVGFFVIQAIFWMIAITFTANDTSHAVISDYDEKALNWDEHKRNMMASDALGWRAEMVAEQSADVYGNRIVSIKIHDAKGEPITGGTVEFTVFHRAHASRVIEPSFEEVGPGIYVAKFRMQRAGRWQLDGTVRKDESTFFVSDEVTILETGS